MSAVTTQSEQRLTALLDERVANTKLHETVIANVQASDDKTPSESQAEQIETYRRKAVELDTEIESLSEDVDRNRKADEASKAIRRMLAGSLEGVDVDGDEIVYRDMATYARDVILTRGSTVCSQIAAQYADPQEVQRAKERLQYVQRTPVNTLTSNIAGLSVSQHIAQIFQVIDTSRPLVASAVRAGLERGTLTYPSITTKPIVAVQATQKTEAGNQGLVVGLSSVTASTYLGGGDLSWQAINWSTPNALDLWFRLVAADYALKTEQHAAQVMQHSGFTYNATTTLSATATFAEFMAAVGQGGGEVFTNSSRLANTIYMAPDRYWYLFGTTSSTPAQFTQVGLSGIGPLNVVVSRGMDAGVIVVGDREGLLVAETPGAPVELRVVEPAIGGVEVGLIGAFASVVTDPGAFSMITTAS